MFYTHVRTDRTYDARREGEAARLADGRDGRAVDADGRARRRNKGEPPPFALFSEDSLFGGR